MVIHTPEDIDFSTFPESDGQPMAETYPNVLQMLDLLTTLETLFDVQGRAGSTTVGANQFVYYNPANGRDNISPDVYAVFDVPPHNPPKWRTWVQGKFPDIVFEITSPSTQYNDLSDAPGGKRARYALLGAREYYIYDPQQEMAPPFLGFERRGGRMAPLPALPDGGIWSPLLRTELRPVALPATELRAAGTWLRVIDPRSGQPIPALEEAYRTLQIAQELLTEEVRARQATQELLTEEVRARQVAERARLAAEDRATQAEATLRALLAGAAHDHDTGNDLDQD